ncbi:MAG TPA: HAMP domain-containing sensor histidine kinase [Candidatus Paceibacterota bacterium]|nr:HAMP domain-containing sensor histidine kinase [Candidatus Paceibacterota bacterium]
MSDDTQSTAPARSTPTEAEKLCSLLKQQEASAKLLIRRDLELQRANDRLRALDQMKTDFVSIATHQMRTPLSGIKWTLSMLLKGDLGPLSDEQRTFLTKAYDSNERMVALIDDLLFSDQIESGKLKSSEGHAVVTDIIESMMPEFQIVAGKREIQIHFEHSADVSTPLSIAPDHLRAILQNLLENAIKYSKSDGIVIIKAEKKDAAVRITVSDQGIGIPEDQQRHLFTRFFRAANAIKMETDGSGLGLFIVKSIVDKYKGTIGFESVENKGTSFYVELPFAKSV